MDPTVKAIFDLVTALIGVVGKPILDAALGHHGYVPRRVEEIRPEHSHGQDAAEELRNGTPVAPPDHGAPR